MAHTKNSVSIPSSGTSGAARSGAPKARRYPKPGPVGGRLIRELIRHLKSQGVSLPLDQSHARVLIAVSGGSDSVALAHLLARYGRKIVTRPRALRLIHVNHGWRGEESDADAAFVRSLSRQLGCAFSLMKARKPSGEKESWEKLARTQRKRYFKQMAEKYRAVILTAHHADDVAETLLWRILTGQGESHAGGIAVRHGHELRPALTLRKKDLKNYLKEEGVEWREDSTNQGGRFLRSRLRQELMPILEHIFPKAVGHLNELARKARERTENGSDGDGLPQQIQVPVEALLGAAGLQARRAHWEHLNQLQGRKLKGRLALPGGWSLEHQNGAANAPERWILQKDKSSEV